MLGCNRTFRDHLLTLEATHTPLVGPLFWLGFLRRTIAYARTARRHGKSAWSFPCRLDYLFDSVFAFTDFPIRALLFAGAFGMLISFVIGTIVLIARLEGSLDVPGYASTVLLILPGITIGARAMIGAGAGVLRSVPPNAIVVGNPGRIVGYVNATRAVLGAMPGESLATSVSSRASRLRPISTRA